MGYIAIVDTGIDELASAYKNVKKQFVLKEVDGCFYVFEDRAKDTIGHGTEIANLIVKENPEAQLLIVRAFDQYLSSVEALMSALDFLNKQDYIDFINLSCGITNITDINGLRKICDFLLLKDTVIVSAFDNNGALSFPAAFDSVIGVDVTGRKDIIGKFYNDYVVNYFLIVIYGIQRNRKKSIGTSN